MPGPTPPSGGKHLNDFDSWQRTVIGAIEGLRGMVAGPGINIEWLGSKKTPVISSKAGGGMAWRTVRIAASDSTSLDQATASIVCDGTDDQDDWCALLGTTAATSTPSAVGPLGMVRLEVCPGTYVFSKSVVLPRFCEIVVPSGTAAATAVTIQPASGVSPYAAFDITHSQYLVMRFEDSRHMVIQDNGTELFVDGITGPSLLYATTPHLTQQRVVHLHFIDVEVTGTAFNMDGGSIFGYGLTSAEAEYGWQTYDARILSLRDCEFVGPGGSDGFAGIILGQPGSAYGRVDVAILREVYCADYMDAGASAGIYLYEVGFVWLVDSESSDNGNDGVLFNGGGLICIDSCVADNNGGYGWNLGNGMAILNSQPSATGNTNGAYTGSAKVFAMAGFGTPSDRHWNGLYNYIDDAGNTGNDCTLYDNTVGTDSYTAVYFPGGNSRNFRT